MSSKYSAEHVLKYGRITKDQKDLILQGAKESMTSTQYDELKESLIEGKINAESRKILNLFVELVEEE